jgi:TetR/AcrR family transcriptional regulator, repressor of fatR-cypB operon
MYRYSKKRISIIMVQEFRYNNLGDLMDKKTGEETMTRREREKAAHRKEIMAAAVKVFARRGFGSATLDEVAQEAEFSKGALYLYFSSKEDILYNILVTMSLDIVREFKRLLSGEKCFREELHDLLIGTGEFSFKNGDYTKLVMAQTVSGFNVISEDGRRTLNEIHDEIIDVLYKRTKLAHENGELRDLPIEAISGVIHGSIDGMATMRWNLDSLEKVKRAVDVFLEIIFNGIGKEKECSA